MQHIANMLFHLRDSTVLISALLDLFYSWFCVAVFPMTNSPTSAGCYGNIVQNGSDATRALRM